MANSEHLAHLKEGVGAWNEWRAKNLDITPDFSKADLSRLNLIGADFQSANFREANLESAVLVEANFYCADLSGACCRGADFGGYDEGTAARNYYLVRRGAILREANFHGADLSGSFLQEILFMYTDLSDATLVGAYLNSAQFASANLDRAVFARTNLQDTQFIDTGIMECSLRQTDFTDAQMSSIVFSGVDLSECRGLATVTHLRPSTVGLDTLTRSRGAIPESFLRGCGFSDSLIKYARSLSEEPLQFYSCFISYSHEDKPFARCLHDALQGRGIRCWLDEKQLLPGDDIYEQVDHGIRLWDKVLLCCSRCSLTSWWVDNEIGTALEKEQQLAKERGTKVHVIIPLNLDGYVFSDSWTNGYRAQVRRRLAANFVGWDGDERKFVAEVENVIRALRADENAREKAPIPRL